MRLIYDSVRACGKAFLGEVSMTKKVYAAILAVQKALNDEGGIGKNAKNDTQGWNFRGIDDVYYAVSPKLNAAGLVVIPRCITRTCEERTTTRGGAIYSVVVEAEFDFICAEDGSMHTARTFGEAMDTGDKATNKAMSVAYKYACFQTFAIPTMGKENNDPDYTTPEKTVKKLKLPLKPPRSLQNEKEAQTPQPTQEKPAIAQIAPPRTQSKAVLSLCAHIATLNDKTLFISYMTNDITRKKLSVHEKREVYDYCTRKAAALGLKCVNKLWVQVEQITP